MHIFYLFLFSYLSCFYSSKVIGNKDANDMDMTHLWVGESFFHTVEPHTEYLHKKKGLLVFIYIYLRTFVCTYASIYVHAYTVYIHIRFSIQ